MPHPKFHSFAVHPGDYPPARVPILPVSVRSALLGRGTPLVPSAFLGKKLTFFPFSRYALAEALRRAGVGEGTAVLLPAFHCRSLVEPAMHLGAEIRFYPVNADLSPAFTSIRDLAADGKVRAMVLTHYFGFVNALDEAQSFCAEQGIALVEDCAHAFYGRHRDTPLGTVGSYATASAWKFFPIRDGAMLRDNTGAPPAKLSSPSAMTELKACAALLEGGLKKIAHRGEPLPAIDGTELATRARVLAHRLTEEGGGDQGTPTYQPEFSHRSGLRASRALVSRMAHGRIAEFRRDNYLRWLKGTHGLAGVRPLFAYLPDGVVPYAFPLLGDAEGKLFHALKLAGIPLWRWEDMAVTDCPISLEYRLRLLQLPCHQELMASEIDWMLAVLKSVSPGLAG